MRDLLAALSELRERLKEIPQADERRLSDLKTGILGRKAGALTQILGRLPKLDPASKKEVGAAANALKREFAAAFEACERELKRAAGTVTGLDLTMPGRAGWQGGLHLVTQVVDEICEIFRELGFTRAVGPEAETERYNFFALNFPKDHPALDAQDSFYLSGDLLLRTHTSPVQIRTLERYPPPIRVVIPGQVYRRDPFDASHSPVFEQLEGLAVDDGITFVDFKATLATFARRFFTADTRVRFRPSFFPFTEPSAEMDVQCQICGGTGGGLRDLQADGLDGDPRLRHGAPRGARELRRGQRALHRLRVGHGARAHRHDPPRHSRHPAAVRERRAIPRAVRGRGAMIVSRRWLEALLDRSLDARDVAERLTLHAAAVDAVVPLHQDLSDVLIARVLEVKKHPDADRLSLCLVDRGGAGGGGGGPVEVVCGAPNVQAGKTYPYAPVGAVLPGGLKLERKKIRGVESNGMLCSAKDLGLGPDHTGILELDTTAPPGARFIDAMGIGDHQIVIDVPANRPDLLCHKGVARELGAYFGVPVKLPPKNAPSSRATPL